MNAINRISQSLLPIALLGLIGAGNLAAQPERGGHRPPELPDAEGIEQMVTELDAALSLSDEQETAVTRLLTAHFDEARELMEKRADRRAMDALREDLDEQLGEVLDDEQVAAYQKLMEERRPQRGGQRPDRR